MKCCEISKVVYNSIDTAGISTQNELHGTYTNYLTVGV